MSTDLPRLYPKTRSGRVCQIPSRLYGTVFFCQEYPDGVYIDKHGRPLPDRSFSIPSDTVCELVPKDLLHTLAPHERREQINLYEDIKCQESHETYVKNDVDYDPDQSQTESSDEYDDDDDDLDESTDIDTGCEEDEDESDDEEESDDDEEESDEEESDDDEEDIDEDEEESDNDNEEEEDNREEDGGGKITYQQTTEEIDDNTLMIDPVDSSDSHHIRKKMKI